MAWADGAQGLTSRIYGTPGELCADILSKTPMFTAASEGSFDAVHGSYILSIRLNDELNLHSGWRLEAYVLYYLGKLGL